MRRFLTAGALMTAVALAAAAAASAAVPSPSYQLGGMAFGSTFFGTGVGSAGDRGTWQANLSVDPSTGSISGGTFTLRSNNRSLIAGTLTGGTMSVTSAAAGCGRQQLAVSANMSSSQGPLLFTGTLSTFRFLLRGVCTTLFATVQGSLAAPPPPDPGSGGSGDL